MHVFWFTGRLARRTILLMKKLLYSVTFVATMIITASLTQGCLIAAVGAGIGAAKYGSAKQKEAYAKYITDMEKINLEREKAKLEPRPIMTYEQWHKGEGTPEKNDADEKK